jgi:hypothetical protein
MRQFCTAAAAIVVLGQLLPSAGIAAEFNFYGRSGDAIEINLAALPGIAAGATFGGLSLGGFAGHSVLLSDALLGQPFASAGRLWVFPNPARNTPATGDSNLAARGFQGTLNGSLLVNDETKTFSVTVQPGYTGSGAGAVGQSLERLNGAGNNPLFVAQQQQRLRYLGFVRQGGGAVSVNGTFDTATDQATRTFQATFINGNNATQATADGIIGPITVGRLNAANAATWEELIDPDPQAPGSFSTNTMIGNFDIYPGRDPGTGNRTGLTLQPERFATSWANDLIAEGSALAKSTTGRTQRINALSAVDGYASSCCHSTHRVGMDIDLYTNASTWNGGNGFLDSEEQIVVAHAVSFLQANATASVRRILTSNQDILGGINSQFPGIAVYDSSGGHVNHLHIDVRPPTQVGGLANLPGDFDLNDAVDAADYVIWRKGLGAMYGQTAYDAWRASYNSMGVRPHGSGSSSTLVVAAPEPSVVSQIAIGAVLFFCGSHWLGGDVARMGCSGERRRL